jgi:hypothetical protein
MPLGMVVPCHSAGGPVIRSRALLATFSAICCLLPATPALARTGPNLVTTSVSAPPGVVQRGFGLAVTDAVRNAGGAGATASVVSHFLSRDTRRGSDLALTGTRRVPALRAGATSTGTSWVAVPPSTAVGRYHVLSCADGAGTVHESSEADNCKASTATVSIVAAKTLTCPGCTTEDRIAKAVKLHVVDPGTAVVYRVFDAFGDPRLPQALRGQDAGVFDTSISGLLAGMIASLPPADRALLTPYLIPPYHQDSWWDLARGPNVAARTKSASVAGRVLRCGDGKMLIHDWDFFQGNGVRVWFQLNEAGDAAKARAVRDAIDGVISNKLDGLFGIGHKPLPDGGSTKACRGGTDDLDISLVDLGGDRGNTFPYADCGVSPVYIYLERSLSSGQMLASAAHEYMHAIQHTYAPAKGCGDVQWLGDATATWVIDFVFGTGPIGAPQFEQQFAPHFLDHPKTPLEDLAGKHEYGAYLLPFFLVRSLNSPGIVPTIWNAIQTTGSLDAIDGAVPGKLQKQWRLFVADNWNRDAVDEYKVWDSLQAGADAETGLHPQPIGLGGNATNVLGLDTDLAHLTARYKWFDFNDPKVRQVVFVRDPNSLGDPSASVTAVTTLRNGSTKVEDWTAKDNAVFCRDKSTEDLDTLALIFGNGHTDVPLPDDGSLLVLRNLCLPMYYKVLSASFTEHTTGSQGHDPQLCSSGVSGDTTFSGTLSSPVFDPSFRIALQPGPFSNGLFGQIAPRVPAHWHYIVNGCNFPPPDFTEKPCSTNFDVVPQPSGTWPIGPSISNASLTATDVTLQWTVSNPSIGFVNGNDANCNVGDFSNSIPSSSTVQTLPLSTFLQKTPFTLHFQNSGHWTQDSLGHPATLDMTWSYTMQVQRVDENGDPLP